MVFSFDLHHHTPPATQPASPPASCSTPSRAGQHRGINPISMEQLSFPASQRHPCPMAPCNPPRQHACCPRPSPTHTVQPRLHSTATLVRNIWPKITTSSSQRSSCKTSSGCKPLVVSLTPGSFRATGAFAFFGRYLLPHPARESDQRSILCLFFRFMPFTLAPDIFPVINLFNVLVVVPLRGVQSSSRLLPLGRATHSKYPPTQPKRRTIMPGH